MVGGSGESQERRSIGFDIANTVFMLLVVAATLYPLYYVAIVSISDGKVVLAGG